MEALSDDDLAEQQLFAESQASAKKAQQTTASSAVQGAFLLNAARIDRRRTVALLPSSSPSHASHTFGHSSPAGMVRTGKLKAPTFLRDGLAKQPTLARRGDPFDLDLSSPENASVRPSSKSKQTKRPPKKTEKSVEPELSPEPQDHIPFSHIPDPDEGEEARPPASSPTSVQPDEQGEELQETPPRTSGRLASEEIDVSNINFAKIPGSKRRAVDHQSDSARQSKSSRMDKASSAEETVLGAAKPRKRDRPRLAKNTHAQVMIPTSKPSKGSTRTVEAEQDDVPSQEMDDAPIQLDEDDGAEEHVEVGAEQHTSGKEQDEPSEKAPKSRKARQSKLWKGTKSNESKLGYSAHVPSDQEIGDPQSSDRVEQPDQLFAPQEEELPKLRGRKQKAKKVPEPPKVTSTQEDDAQDTSGPVRRTRVRTRNTSSGSAKDSMLVQSKPTKVLKTRSKADDFANAYIAEEAESDPVNSHSLDAFETTNKHRDGEGGVPEIQQVFKFLDSGARSGDCESKQSKEIKRASQAGCDLLADDEATLEEVSTTTKDLQRKLATFGAESNHDERLILKADAYGYLFWHIAIYLESLHDWLKLEYSDFESSLEAMRIISPFVNFIVSFKDSISAWKIKLPERQKGDGFVRDVDYNFIAPLRTVAQNYSAILRKLKMAKAQEVKTEGSASAAKEYREGAEAKQQEQDIQALRSKKLKLWIDLHVCRLQVEPNGLRRESLSFQQDYFDAKITNTEERDANGVHFERVDVFKKRVVPPARRSSHLEEQWTDAQMAALIDGLTRFAGSYVFHSIFETYCGSAGPLRRFGVPEITAKAADVRARLLAKFQEEGWQDIPEWIKKIPVLP